MPRKMNPLAPDDLDYYEANTDTQLTEAQILAMGFIQEDTDTHAFKLAVATLHGALTIDWTSWVRNYGILFSADLRALSNLKARLVFRGTSTGACVFYMRLDFRAENNDLISYGTVKTTVFAGADIQYTMETVLDDIPVGTYVIDFDTKVNQASIVQRGGMIYVEGT